MKHGKTIGILSLLAGLALIATPLGAAEAGGPKVMAMATSGALAILLAVSIWPGDEGEVQIAGAEPVIVQDVDTPDPDGSVMVYSAPDHGPERGVTVIWVFASADGR